MCERGNEQPGLADSESGMLDQTFLVREAALETPTLARPVGLCSVPPAQKAGLRHQESGIRAGQGRWNQA